VEPKLAMLTIVEFFYDFVISTLMGLFGLHLITKKGGLLAAKFLGLSFIAICIRIVLAYFITGGRLIQYPHTFMLVSPIQFLAGPVGFLFVYFMLYPKRKFRVWQAVLFLPFVLHTAELMPFYFGPVEDKINEINLMLRYKSLVDFPGTVTFFCPKVLTFIKVVLSTFYVLASFVLVISYIRKNRISLKFNRFLLNWMLSYTSLGLLSMVFIIAYVMGIIGFNNLQFSYADLLMHLAAFVNLGVVLYRPALLDQHTFKILVERLDQEHRQPDLNEDAEKLKKYEEYAKWLEEFFAKDKPFLDPDLSLDKTAKILQISTKDLSRTTAYIYELGYPDFVNSWRINYIVEQRNSDKQWQEYSQDMLAELSGFGSRQSFHNAVNRLHGTTPASFFSERVSNR
jgi:AraC-like DNA-binding protein